jgi:hypothetical protein
MAKKAVPRRRPKGRRFTLARLRSAIDRTGDDLSDVDQRSEPVRRLSQLAREHITDLGGEGLISHAERVLVKRCAMLVLQLELIELRWVSGSKDVESGDLDAYQRCVNTLRRTLEALGLQRRPKDVIPSLDEYLARQRTHTADGNAAESTQ